MGATESILDDQAVDAEINYIWNPRVRPQDETLKFVTEAEEESTMQTLPGRTVRQPRRGRCRRTSTAEGFVLGSHTS